MNVERMEKVADVIMQHPEDFDMRWWGGASACRTTGCIGGWAVVLFDENFKKRVSAVKKPKYLGLFGENPALCFGDVPNFEVLATNALGLTEEEADKLFHVSGWDHDLKTKWCNNHEKAATVAAAAAAVQIYRMVAEYKANNPAEAPVETEAVKEELQLV